MTDRRVGGLGLNVDLAPVTARRVGSVVIQFEAVIQVGVRVLVGRSDGVATAAATLTVIAGGGTVDLIGSSAGQATASATLTVLGGGVVREVSGSSTGRATVSGVLSMMAVTRQLVGSSPGRATARLTLGKRRLLVGRSNGVGDAPRIRIKLTKPRMLVGSSAGQATVAASVLGTRKTLAGAIAGRGTTSASLSATRALVGRTDGVATVTAFVFRPPRLDVFLGIATSSGTATVSLAWGFRRDLIGTSSGTGGAVALGFGQARLLAGQSTAASTCSGWLVLTEVIGPVTPAEVFGLRRPRRLAHAVSSRETVFSPPERRSSFVASRRK